MLVEYGCVGGLEEKTEYRGMQRWVMGVGQGVGRGVAMGCADVARFTGMGRVWGGEWGWSI